MKQPISRFGRTSPTTYGLLCAIAASSVSCLQRPVQELTPNTSNVFVAPLRISTIKTIDMLFVIDNSVSMGDKQQILKVAVPKMVERLVAPNCVDETNAFVARSQLQGNDLPPTCPANSTLEFNPVSDIHLGIISSSLGAHGTDACENYTEESPPRTWQKDDRANLIPVIRQLTDKGENDLGFLAWTGGDEAAAATLNERFAGHVAAVGEMGCGYEATLEAWYRFLVDPNPPYDMKVDPATHWSEPTGPKENPTDWVEKSVLAQRAAFLRPEGLLAIVMLSDENDCSIMDGGEYYNNARYGHLLTSKGRMSVATQVCDTNPNDACCLSCLQANGAADACRAQVDAACNPGGSVPVLAEEADAANVRCFNNKQRFGVDLLYPTQRYVDALTRTELVDARTGLPIDNPILRSQGKVRDPDRVFLAGVVGVPWQDIATEESRNSTNPDTMRYLRADELNKKDVDVGGVKVDRWELILGQPNLPADSSACQAQAKAACGVAPVAPLDPFMVEQIEPREEGKIHPLVPTAAISRADSLDPQDNPINGHEYNTAFKELIAVNDDLQYACTFPLTTPKDAASCADSVSCDCSEEPGRNRPLCQPPGGGPAEPAQYWAKAYPSTRILQVLRDFGDNSIVGSICPKVVDDDTKEDYGYNPAVQAIVDRLAEGLKGPCLPREVTLDAEGKVPCFVVETKPPRDASDPSDVELNCNAAGREPVGETVKNAVRKQLAANRYCSDKDHPTASGGDCEDWQMCSIVELLREPGRGQCLYNAAPADSLAEPGFCYIDPKKQSEDGKYIAGGSAEEAAAAQFPATVKVDGTNTLVDACEPTQRRILRFVGESTPAEGTTTMVACTGDAAGADAPIPSAPEPTSPDTEEM